MKYMDKVFDAMNFPKNWTNNKEIDLMFDTAKKFDQSQILHKFLKRMKIMNRQYFKYIMKLPEVK